jgi:hypothetical protein
MDRSVATATVGIALLWPLGDAAWGQASGSNPDVSAIASFLYCPQGPEDCPLEGAEADLELQEVELALQGYLNPYVRGDLFIGWEDDETEVEEAYASFVRGLGSFQARIGKYLVGWGSINALHPHAYSWIFRPLAEERLLGAEGLNQIAARLDYSLPVGERGEFSLSADLLRGDLVDEHGEDDGAPPPGGTLCVGPGCADGICEPGDADCALVFYDPGEAAPEEETEPAWHVRASYFQQVREAHSVRVGLDFLSGTLDPALDRRVTLYGTDLKYRWRPSRYRALDVIAAYLRSEADLAVEELTGSVCLGPDCVGDVCPLGGVCLALDQTETVRGPALASDGWYALADWQFRQRWNGGVKLDRSEGLESSDAIRRAEAFVNFRLMEESTLFRLLVRHEERDASNVTDTLTALQLVFSLGPHRPHAF